MSWYKTGQINITNGSQTVVGVGTNFARFVESGEALLAPDGKHYEIATVLSATELRLVSSYTGATASAQSYAIVPVQGYVRDLAYKAADLIDAHKSVPGEVLAHAEAAEQSAVRAEAAKVGSGDAKTQAESSAAAAASSATAAQGSKNSAATSAQAAQSSATAAATSATAAASSASAAASSKSAAATSESAALASKNAAAASESAALASKNAAATSASAAATSASAAATSASAAATSATAAEQSKIASATYESDARASRTGAEDALAGAVTAKNEALASQTSARTSMDAAAASSASASASSAAAAQHRDKAKDWADKTDGEVEAGKYSARYWAELASSITTGGVIYMGTWSAQTGAYPATPSRGHLYKVSTAGTVGGGAYSVKDMIIYNGESWDKIDTTDEVTSVAGKVGAVVLTKGDVGLSNVDNTSDTNKPVSSATEAALNTKVDKVAGKQLSTEDYTAAEKSKLAGVAAGAQVNTVTSVAGKTGDVTLAKGDVGLGNVDDTSDTNKPVSTAQAAAIALKADASALATWKANPTGVQSLNNGPLGGMRNRIINGCFRVAQRPAAVLAENTAVYGGADRFFSYVGGFTTVSGQTAQQTTSDLVFSSSGFDQFMTLTTTGTGTISQGTRLESKDVFDLSGKTITVKVNVFQGIGNVPVYLKLSKANAKDDFSAVTPVAQSEGASIPVGGTGAVTLTTTLGATDAANGLQVEVLMLNVGAVTNKNYVIANFSLELGTVATPFEHRHYGQELALCQRYYEEVAYRVDTAIASAAIFGSAFIAYKATKRTLPTLSHKELNVNNCAFNSFQRTSVQGCTSVYQPSSAAGFATATLVADAEL